MTPKEILDEAKIENEKNNTINLHKKNIRIFSSPEKEWNILSYYYSEELKCMILDIEEKDKWKYY